MNYRKDGFRPLYKNFCIFPMNDVIRNAFKETKGIEEVDGVLVYGYVDHEAGNSVEFVAFTKYLDEKKYAFAEIPDEARYYARIEHLADEEFQFVNYGDSPLYTRFKSRIDKLAIYDGDEKLERTRSMSFLDEFRYQYSFDDVKVILFKDGYELEGAWVKIETIEKGVIFGTLMNTPKQELGVTTGSPIAFHVNEDKDGKRMLVSYLTLGRVYTEEELKDGKVLKAALETFRNNKNQFTFYAVYEILRNSTILVPHTKNGVEFLVAGKKKYFPVFSESLEMWQCEINNLQKVEMTFAEAVKKAEKDKSISGILVNFYSDALIIPRTMFELF